MFANFTKEESQKLDQILKPNLSDKTNSPKTISTQISLDIKKFSHKPIKINKPNKPQKIEVLNNTLNENILANHEIKLSGSNKASEINGYNFQTGKWTEEEHEKFIEGILNYGNEWKKVQQIIKTRSSTQARSHAQKFFLRIKKLMKYNNKKEKDEKIENILSKILPKKYANKLTQDQKEKLLSAISSNIKYEDDDDNNIFVIDDEEICLEENDYNLDYKINNNDKSVIIKNNKISLDLSILNANDDILIQNKATIGRKRKPGKNKANKDKNIKIKKEESRKSSFDFPFGKLNDKENIDDLNYLNNFGFVENDFMFKNSNNIFENKRKNSINSNNPNNKQFSSGIAENKNNYIINNVINVTNNIINNNYYYNIFNHDINNNCMQDFYCNEKNDVINNDKNFFHLGTLHNYEKFSNNDKNFFNGNQFNNNKNNDYNEDENYNDEHDPFKLNFNSFSNENLFDKEEERQMSVHENDFIKLVPII